MKYFFFFFQLIKNDKNYTVFFLWIYDAISIERNKASRDR